MTDTIFDWTELVGIGSPGWTTRSYQAGAIIANAGAQDGRVYVVVSGWGSIDRTLADGKRQIIDFTLPGDLVSLWSNGKPLRESFRAITDVTVQEIPAPAFHKALMRDMSTVEIGLRALNRQSAIRTEHIVNCGVRNAQARMAHLLLELLARTDDGKRHEDGYEWPLTQSDLADALGLTAVHVNRTLAGLRRRNLVDYRYGRLKLLDRRGLKAVADFEELYLS